MEPILPPKISEQDVLAKADHFTDVALWPLRSELNSVSKSMRVDATEPWEQVIRVQQPRTLDDGWAHSMDDDSREGLLHEMHGMFANDKHEQFMEKFYQQQADKAAKERQRVEEIVRQRGGPGVTSEVTAILTDTESRQRERDLRKGRPILVPVKREEITPKPEDKIQKYR